MVERAEYGGTVETLRDQTLYTGSNYVTQVAPQLGGYIFTHWTTTATEGFQSRDFSGRSFDAAPFTLYDNVTLTAHYVEDDLDSDNDGTPDSEEAAALMGISKEDADRLLEAINKADSQTQKKVKDSQDSYRPKSHDKNW